jgi:Zn-dependent M16 (insulinase) family peptidase
LLNNPRIAILAKPSSQLAQDLEKNEMARTDKQRKELGPQGLLKMKQKVEEAQKQNHVPIPEGIIQEFKIPNIEDIKFIETTNAVYVAQSKTRGQRNAIERHLDSDPSDYPINLVFSHTSTHFVTLNLYITTKDIPAELLPYLWIYLTSFFSLPIMRDGKLVGYENVVNEINRLTTDVDSGLGMDEVSEVIYIQLRAEKSRYKQLVKLLHELLVNSVFDPER